MRFSIVLISKNEEKTLPHLFKSIKEFKDKGGEVIVLDTGSTDSSVQVAKDFGCKVEEVGDRFVKTIKNADEINKRFIVDEEPIIKNGDKLFDFSKARNYAASLSSNDWVFSPDCDEVLTSFDLDKLNKVIENGAEQLEYNFVFSHDQYKNEAIKFLHSKFYDRRKLSWKNIVHEVLTGKVKRTYLDESIIKLEHFQQPKEERGRYLSGLALDCFENQDNDRNSHYLARELLWNNRPKSAIKEFSRHIAMNKWKAERGQSMIFMGDAYGKLKDESKQVEWYLKAWNLDPDRREALMRLAQLYYKKGDRQRTACYCSAALQIPWNGYYANQHQHYAQEPHELLYWALWDINREQSKYHWEQCIKYQPNNPKYIEDAKFYFEYSGNKIEGWMTFPELQFLYKKSKEMKSICEVGSWKGRSTHALLTGCKGKVTAVDHFNGSAQKGDRTHSEKATDEVYLTFFPKI
ncbi:MAG: glycosyltransferase [Candidatus Heimdallarchaeaceae archaeon]